MKFSSSTSSVPTVRSIYDERYQPRYGFLRPIIPGVSSLDKIKDTIDAAGMRLTPEEMAELDTMENGVVRNADLKW